MPRTTLANKAAGAAFKEYLPFTRRLARKFAWDLGGCPDDYESHGNELFLKAWNDWNNGTRRCTRFQPHLRLYLWYGWLDKRRVEFTRDMEFNTDVVYEQHATPARSYIDFVDALTEDGAYVAALVQDPPDAVMASVARRSNGRAPHPRTFKSVLRVHLGQNGWPKNRILDAFAELEEACAQG